MNIVDELNQSFSFEQRWENLTLANDFMFGKVFQDADLCLELVRLILPELNTERIILHEQQKSAHETIDTRGVRFDVYLHDDKGRIEDRLRYAKQNLHWRYEYVLDTLERNSITYEAEQRGIAIGEERGIVIGEQRANITMALRLRQAGMDDSYIHFVTGLSLEEIQNLKHIKRG